MNKAEKYIAIATAEKVRSRGLIKSVATEAARLQREETRLNAIEVYKQMCPSKISRGCASQVHKNETKSTRCDGCCARIKFLVNGLDRLEV